MKYDVIVVGGGAAGLVAAARAGERGLRILVLEKMNRPGRKLLITGKGRCNITNNLTISEFSKSVYPNGKFLRTAFSQFFSKDIISVLKKLGVETVLERGNRYFPVSNKAEDVQAAFLSWCKQNSVEIKTKQKVDNLLVEDNVIKGVVANGNEYFANNVIIATGGKSYPATGSTGDGYELAKSVGHTVIKPQPALVPLETVGNMAKELQGLTLKNVKASVWVNGKKTAEEFGEMLFTHFGISGPIILTLSRMVVAELYNKNKVEVSIDLKPALDDKKLDDRLIRDLNEHGKKKLINIFKYWLPAAMIPVFIETLQLDADKECHQVSGKERKQIRHLMKNLVFKISKHRSFKEAIVTAGGVATNEISPKTMESKLVKGLYFAGELIDVDGQTGGFNLQIAYSTAWLAANSCQA